MAVEIKAGHTQQLRQTLKLLNAGPAREEFEGCASLLFVSGVILKEQFYQEVRLPETLILTTNYSGLFSVHLKELSARCKKTLCAIFRHCNGFPDYPAVSDLNLSIYIQSHARPSDFSSGYDCMTKEELGREKNCRLKLAGISIKHRTPAHSKTKQLCRSGG